MVRESTINYFGRSFKAVDWHLIPGNNGSDNPWNDEEPIRQAFWNSFEPGQVVIDIGTCFGLYTLPALMQGCRVIALEPNEEFLALTTESVKMNPGFADNYIGKNIGVWNNSSFPKELEEPVLNWCKKKSPFITTTIDELTQGIDRVDMIKIDVEGAELGVLDGAKETIRKYRPSFLIEDHIGLYDYCAKNNTSETIKVILNNAGYNMKVVLFGGPPPPGGGRYFIIATPKEKEVNKSEFTKLNLGSGISGFQALNVITTDHTGWKSIDICADYKPTECYDVSEGIREKDNTIEEIWMGDFFEHMLRVKAKFVMKECYRVMKPGAKMKISVPDMSIIMPMWLKNDERQDELSQLVWGDQDEMFQKNSIPSAHFHGYTEKSLAKLLSDVGFKDIKRIGIHKNFCELAFEVYK